MRYFILIFIVLGKINLMNEEEVLSHDLRRSIYYFILENPGVHLREIKRIFNVSLSTVLWHLRILEKSDLIISKKVENRLLFFPRDFDIENYLTLISIKNKPVESILSYLEKNASHIRGIARELNLHPEVVRYNLRKLERAGVVKSKEEGNRVVYSIV